MMKVIFITTTFTVAFCLSGLLHAAENPQSFHYEGVLTDLDDTPILETVDLRFAIYDPSGSCLLYHETRTSVDLSATDGRFAFSVGSPTSSSLRTSGTDPGLSMDSIFANKGQSVSVSTNCPSGYSPVANDSRKIQVTIVRSGSADALPMQDILSVPYANVAQSLQGFTPGNFIQADSTVSQSALNDLALGTSALYLKPGETGSVDFGTGLSYTTGQISIGDSSAPNANISLETTKAIRSGQYSSNQLSTLTSSLSSCGASCIGAVVTNTTTNTLNYWDGSSFVEIATNGDFAGDPLLISSPAAGHILQYTGSSWINSPPGGGGDVSYATASSANTDKLVRFSSSSGTLIKGSSVGIDDLGSVTGVLDLTATGTLIVDTDTLYVDDGLRKVGIGTTSPTTKLDVDGTIASGSTAVTGAIRLRDGAGGEHVELLAPFLSSNVTLTLPTSQGTTGQFLQATGGGVMGWANAVSGPVSATDNRLVRMDGSTGSLIQQSNVLLDDSGNASGFINLNAQNVSVTGSFSSGGSGTAGSLKLFEPSDIDYVELRAPATIPGGPVAFILPNSLGAAGDVLRAVDGAGNLGWAAAFSGLSGAVAATGAGVVSINNDAITSAAIVSGAVTTDEIADGTIASGDLSSAIGVWTTASSDVYRSSGNVGIGTASPGSILDVKAAGAAQFTVTSAAGNTGLTGLKIVHEDIDTAGADGIGVAVDFLAESTAGGTNEMIASISSAYSDQANGNSRLSFKTRYLDAMFESLVISELGVGVADNFVVGNFTINADIYQNRVGIGGVTAPSGILHVEAANMVAGNGEDIILNAQNAADTGFNGGNVTIAGGTPGAGGVPGGIKLGGTTASPFRKVVSATVGGSGSGNDFDFVTTLSGGSTVQKVSTVFSGTLLGMDTVICTPNASIPASVVWSCFVSGGNVNINVACASGPGCDLSTVSWRLTAIMF